MNSTNGTIAGTPTTAGDYTFQIKVSDGTRSDAQTYSLSIVPKLAIGPISGVAEPVFRSRQRRSRGWRPGYSWSLDGGTALPAGLTMDPATGAISGKPTVAGS